MRPIPRFAVISTHNRPVELERCLDSLCPQADRVFVIDNASDPPVGREVFTRGNAYLVSDPEQPPNLSRLWNIGIDAFASRTWFSGPEINDAQWDVAIINDDAVLPSGWYEYVSEAMRRNGCDAAAVSPLVHDETVLRGDAPFSTHTRLTGWAFLLCGESLLRFDERFRWWCGDDDISARARQGRGLVLLPGQVENTLANLTTVGTLADQVALDMQAFVDKWGVRPW